MDIEVLLRELEATKNSLLNAQSLILADPKNEELQSLYQEVFSLFNLQLEEIKSFERLDDSKTEAQSFNTSAQFEHKPKDPIRESSPVDIPGVLESSEDSDPGSYRSPCLKSDSKVSYGLGYKLLKKMGYKDGKGLGRNKQGITKPVEVTLWSNGESIDKLIKNRDKKDKKPKHDGIKNKGQEIPLFSFINQTIKTDFTSTHVSTLGKTTISSDSIKEKKYDVRTAQSLLASVQEKIIRLEKQINYLNTRQTHSSKTNPSVASEIKRQIQPLLQQLSLLRSQEQSESVKINSHKTRSKMTEF